MYVVTLHNGQVITSPTPRVGISQQLPIGQATLLFLLWLRGNFSGNSCSRCLLVATLGPAEFQNGTNPELRKYVLKNATLNINKCFFQISNCCEKCHISVCLHDLQKKSIATNVQGALVPKLMRWPGIEPSERAKFGAPGTKNQWRLQQYVKPKAYSDSFWPPFLDHLHWLLGSASQEVNDTTSHATALEVLGLDVHRVHNEHGK